MIHHFGSYETQYPAYANLLSYSRSEMDKRIIPILYWRISKSLVWLALRFLFTVCGVFLLAGCFFCVLFLNDSPPLRRKKKYTNLLLLWIIVCAFVLWRWLVGEVVGAMDGWMIPPLWWAWIWVYGLLFVGNGNGSKRWLCEGTCVCDFAALLGCCCYGRADVSVGAWTSLKARLEIYDRCNEALFLLTAPIYMFN
jgi:hypothetical protein